MPETDPRKLRSSFLSRLKQGSNGMPLIDAQTAWPRTCSVLPGACRTHVIEYPACATGAIETGKGKHLAGYKPAGLIGTHLDGQSGNDHRTGRNGPQHETRKHAVTPTDSSAGNRLMSLYPLLTIPT